MLPVNYCQRKCKTMNYQLLAVFIIHDGGHIPTKCSIFVHWTMHVTHQANAILCSQGQCTELLRCPFAVLTSVVLHHHKEPHKHKHEHKHENDSLARPNTMQHHRHLC